MENLKLGELITGEQRRDAIHIAVAPVTATEVLNPGQLIGFDEPGCDKVRARLDGIGIVDPFLKKAVTPGQRFWMFLLPYTITGLRHEWTHPAWNNSIEESVKWLKAYAATHCHYDMEYGEQYTYDKFMDRVRAGEIFYHGDDLHGQYELDDAENLFAHLSIVLGRAVRGSDFGYSCSC